MTYLKEEKEKLHVRFVKWDGIRRDYFTVVINLFLTFSVGALAFLLKIFLEPDYEGNIFLTISLFLMFLTAIIGTGTSVSRLFDFRKTAKKLRLQEKQIDGDNISDETIAQATKLKNFYEVLTWVLFYGQIITFILAILSSLIYIIVQYKCKLT